MTEAFHALGVSDVWQLIAGTMLFLLLPGPGTLCILTCSAKHGVRGGMAALAGLMVGDAALMFLAAVGVAALLKANPLLFTALQYIGAGYLAWLGLRLLIAKNDGGETLVPFSQAADFRRGFLVTLINPKAIVFYMAFFPLFIDPANHQGWVTFITLSSVVMMCTLLYGSFLVLVGNAAARKLARNQRLTALVSRLAGLLLIGFGIKLTTN